jgi:hypothetical protein
MGTKHFTVAGGWERENEPEEAEVDKPLRYRGERWVTK